MCRNLCTFSPKEWTILISTRTCKNKNSSKRFILLRAELYAALVNTHTGEVAKRSFKDLFKSSTKFTDSQITLHWISNDEKPLKQWVRNRVIEICRFTSRNQLFYIQSKNMMADLGTRRGATFKDVDQNSSWINRFEWMQKPTSEFPVQSSDDLKLSEAQLSEVEKEQSIDIHHFIAKNSTTMTEVHQRYEFSQYLIDPNRHRFSLVVRIMA